jgi:uncharacterized protein YndB with AHSA1/START domain
MTSTRVARHLAAPPDAVYRALIDRETVARWRFPRGMSCAVHEWEPREGGTIRVSLTYDAPDQAGKTSAHTDTYRGRFTRLVPDQLVVEVDEFETSDAGLQGEMTVTVRLSAADGGTDLEAVHDGLPPGVRPSDNELGWQEALDRLAAVLEQG